MTRACDGNLTTQCPVGGSWIMAGDPDWDIPTGAMPIKQISECGGYAVEGIYDRPTGMFRAESVAVVDSDPGIG